MIDKADEWYKHIKRWAYGHDNTNRRNVSSSPSNKTDDRRTNITRSTSGKLL